MASNLKTCSIFLAREVISDGEGHWMAVGKVRKSSQMNETLAMLWEQLLGGFALEVYSHNQHIELCFTASEEQISAISSALYTMIPTASIVERDDFLSGVMEHDIVVTEEYGIVEPRYPILPFITYDDNQHDAAGPYLNILSVLPPGYKVIVQFVARSLPETSMQAMRYKWQAWSWLSSYPFRPLYWFKPGVAKKFKTKYPGKIISLMFQMSIRTSVVVSASHDISSEERKALESKAKACLNSVSTGLKFINYSDMGRLKVRSRKFGKEALSPVIKRQLLKPFLMTSQELATLWHPVFVDKHMNIAQVLASRGNPPAALFAGNRQPSEISLFGRTNFRQGQEIFGIRREDRKSHLHILGKSGAGKSKLIELLVQSDMQHGCGLALLDCHGDLVDDVLQIVPEHRIKDIAIFDVSDYQFPPCFNPFENVYTSERQFVARELVDMFKKVDALSLSEAAERLLQNCVLTLLETPKTTLYSLFEMLGDRTIRNAFVEQLPAGPLLEYWSKQEALIDELLEHADIFRVKKILSRLLSTNLVGCILAQQENKFDLVRMMDERKIILMKVPKKNLGRQNTVLLGTLLLTSLRLAAATRAHRDGNMLPFYIYIDEFQNFATDSFAKSLTDAAKQGVSYTIAHQMLKQLPEGVKDVLMSKVGNVISFQIGSEDAHAIESRFSPPFDHLGLMNLNLRNFYIRMMLDGAPQDAFSGRTIDIAMPKENFVTECIEQSRRQYSKDRVEILADFEQQNQKRSSDRQVASVLEGGS